MTLIPELIGPVFFALACAIALLSGFVKGAVGFGMPMIMISGLGSFLSPELALAALIFPTVLSNAWQSLRGGLTGAVAAVRQHWKFIVPMLVLIMISAGLVSQIPVHWLFLILGVMVSGFAIAQLVGFEFEISETRRTMAQVAFGSMAGFVGGLSGVWGPPTVAYLTALKIPKVENVRVQGVIYGAGSVVLLVSHLKTGLINAQSLPLAVWMIVPAMLGMAVGLRSQDRLDQDKFRRMTLVVLVIAGVNLMRRGLIG